MKSKYIVPATEIVDVELETLLASSIGETNSIGFTNDEVVDYDAPALSNKQGQDIWNETW